MRCAICHQPMQPGNCCRVSYIVLEVTSGASGESRDRMVAPLPDIDVCYSCRSMITNAALAAVQASTVKIIRSVEK